MSTATTNDKMWINATYGVLIATLELAKATHMADKRDSTNVAANDLLTFQNDLMPEIVKRCRPLAAAIEKAKGEANE